MIVCPSCNTHYRRADPAWPAGALAQCSRCDESFPLAERRRTYVLAPLARGRVRVGLDDPRLAERVGIDLPPFGDDGGSGEVDRSPALRDLEALLASAEEAVTGSSDAGELAGLEPVGHVRRDWPIALGAAVIPSGLGAGVAYFLAVEQQADPLLWTALAGFSGLLLGRLWLSWFRPRNP